MAIKFRELSMSMEQFDTLHEGMAQGCVAPVCASACVCAGPRSAESVSACRVNGSHVSPVSSKHACSHITQHGKIQVRTTTGAFISNVLGLFVGSKTLRILCKSSE